MTDLLRELKTYDLDHTNLDELITLSAFAKQLKTEYGVQNCDAPKWLNSRTDDLRRAIRSKQTDIRTQKLQEILMRLETLKSADEKRTELQAEAERLANLLPQEEEVKT